MKTHFILSAWLFVAISFLAIPLSFTGCSTAPSQRVVEVQTLKAIGQAADFAVATTAHLYADGKITAAQAEAVNDFYDKKFQPAFKVAVSAAQANLDSLASPDLANLAGQLSALVASYTTK